MVEQNSPDCQEKSGVILDSAGFFKRVCLVLSTESTTEIGRRVGLSKSAINLWKKGQMPGGTTLEGVVRVANVANVSLEWLLTGQGEMPTIRTRQQRAEEAAAFLRDHFKPEVAAALKQWAGNDPELLCEFACVLVEKALQMQPSSRTIAEVAADYMASTTKGKKGSATERDDVEVDVEARTASTSDLAESDNNGRRPSGLDAPAVDGPDESED